MFDYSAYVPLVSDYPELDAQISAEVSSGES
jgi:hypothetical protein